MKKIFGRRHLSSSVDSTPRFSRRASLPNPEPVNLASSSNFRSNSSDDVFESILPTSSVALSDTETLQFDRLHQFELQQSYDENFELYLPFVVRRMRYTAVENGNAYEDTEDFDTPTIHSTGAGTTTILGKPTASFTKREMILADEFIKSSCYIFASRESFSQFQNIRLKNGKKSRKNSMVVYEDHSFKRIAANSSHEGVVDNRNHIVPLEYKAQGKGMPLLKLQVPYMSMLRKNTPYMTFRRFKEIPAPPEVEDEEHETYRFCNVHLKTFSLLKRFTLTFMPAGEEEFKVFVFQHNFRSFADFHYKNTRFRVLGTPPTGSIHLVYNPVMRLVLIDSGLPSLSDRLVDKKPDLGKADADMDPINMNSPYPHPKCPLLDLNNYGYFSMGLATGSEFTPHDLPPFGKFSDGEAYIKKHTLLPKKFSESGKFEVYQDMQTDDVDSTFSVDLDTIVLTCVVMALREFSIRSTMRTSNNSVVGRLSVGAQPLFTGPANFA